MSTASSNKLKVKGIIPYAIAAKAMADQTVSNGRPDNILAA